MFIGVLLLSFTSFAQLQSSALFVFEFTTLITLYVVLEYSGNLGNMVNILSPTERVVTILKDYNYEKILHNLLVARFIFVSSIEYA